MTNLKDIAKHLVEKHELTAADAEYFIAQFIETLQDSVLSEKLVKVKGLGAFKLTPISARESIDVNTGDRIVIEGRDKITFTPDNAMKDLVNRPFSQFDTVVLNAGVAFDEAMEDNISEIKNASPSNQEKKECSIGIANEKQAVALAEEENKNQAVNSDVTEKEDSEVRENIFMADMKDKPEPTPSSTINAEGKKLTRETAVLTPQIKNDPPTTAFNQSETIAPIQELEQETEVALETSHQPIQRWIKWTMGFCICSLIVLMGICFYLMGEIHLRNHRIDNLMTLMQQKRLKKENTKAKITSATSTTMNRQFAKNDSLVERAQQIDRQQHQTRKMATKDVQYPSVTSKVIAKSSEYEAMNQRDVRIRTGAYNIIGIKTIVKVGAGQTLHAISDAYLGPGMECYIEALNSHNLPLKAGDEVKIPLLRLKKHANASH